MAFESIKTKEFEFGSKMLHRFRFREGKALSQLGFLEITHDDEGNVQTARCLHNQLLEYCAALHVAENPTDLQYIIDTFSSADYDVVMAEGLGFWRDTLLFSVGINPEVLSTLSRSRFALRVPYDTEVQHRRLDLSYEAGLIHETESAEAMEQFCEALMNAPLQRTHTTEVINN